VNTPIPDEPRGVLASRFISAGQQSEHSLPTTKKARPKRSSDGL